MDDFKGFVARLENGTTSSVESRDYVNQVKEI